MRIGDLMSHPVRTVPPHATADQAWELMQRERFHHLVVSSDGSIVGVISARDLASAAQRRGRSVGQLMSAPAITTGPEVSIKRAAAMLRGRNIGCLPVLERGCVVGIVTVSDLLELIATGSWLRPVIDDRDGKRRRQRRLPFARGGRSAAH